MAKNIEPKLKKIGDYLKLETETVFTIPEYQRPYSWEINHCDKLWQDITNYLDSGIQDRYFFGTIIINCQDNDSIFALIDGQQRTTTFLLLLKALLIRINDAIIGTEQDEDSESLCRGLKARRRMIIQILYKSEIEDIPDKPDKMNDRKICSVNPILKNYSINENKLYVNELFDILSSVDYNEAESRVYKIPRKQKDNKYTNYFRNFKYFYEKASKLHDSTLNKFTKILLESCEVIEIKSWQVEQAIDMFNSLNSDGLPLYDADVISAKLYAAAEKRNNGNEYNDLWKELIEIINELNQNRVANINTIFMQQMYYQRAKDKEIVSENGSTDVTTPGLRRYFTYIKSDLLNEPIDLCKQMINVAKIWKKVSSYPIMQVLLKFNDNTKLFLGSYFHRYNVDEISEELITEIAVCFLRLFAVLELVDIGYSSSAFKTFLFKESEKLVDQNFSVQQIKDDFDKHISKTWNSDELKKYVIDYDKNILVYLNEFLFAKEKGISFEFGEKYDIEHIMPQSGANIDEIRKDAHLENKEDFDNTVNKLGNKIVLEEKINRAIGNQWFRTKVSTKNGYINSCYPFAKALVEENKSISNPYWCKNDIDDATEKASNRIIKFIFNI